MLLSNQLITEEIKEIKKYLKTNENENTAIQNLWDAAKAVQRRKFIAYKTTSGNKKNLKQPNLIPKGTRKRTHKLKVSRHKDQSRNK